MNILLFEDAEVDRLAPLALVRPACSLSCGGMSLVDLAAMFTPEVKTWVRRHLRGVQPREQSVESLHADQPTLFVNARMVPDARAIRWLWDRAIGDPIAFRMVASSGALVAALAPPKTLQQHLSDPMKWMSESEVPSTPAEPFLQLLCYPHDLIRGHLEILRHNLEFCVGRRDVTEQRPGVFVAEGVKFGEHCVIDASDGPVLLDQGVRLGPHVVIKGPCRIGRETQLAAHTNLRGGVGVGPRCKLGGEVSQSTIEGFCNKAHFGYLGSSYVGGWVNLGAGTTTSNLKNTYGTVRVMYGEEKVDTGMQFLGAMIGDYCKTAINTSIFTGKVLGICSNVYGFVTKNVPSFANYAQSFGEVTEHPVDVMVASQKRMFARRGRAQRECDVRLMHEVYEMEAPKRQLANHPPTF